jgi:transposase
MNTLPFFTPQALYRLKKIVQWNPNRPLARRANAILLWAQGKPKAEIARLLQAARSSVNRWIKWYLEDDLDGLQADLPGKKVRFPPTFIGELLKLLISFRPQDFGYQRSRWSSELLSIVIREALNIVLHSSTIRRWLPKHGIVWRRAAPTLQIKDPDKEAKLAAIKQALASCDAENPVFYEDEVDIHLNPKIGADWGLRGQQRKVVTPGQNKKHFLAGALHSSSGQVTYVGSTSKNTVLFIDLLRALRRRYRSAKTITLIVDNYIIHKSKIAEKWLKNNPKFKLLFLPVYSPWHNKIELLWHSLHETITRNHTCRSMDELLERVEHFMDTVSPFPGGGHGSKRV